MHIRCKACQQYLAGPLNHQRLHACSELNLFSYSEFADIDFQSDSFQEFAPQSQADLLIHAQWCDIWRTDWPDQSVQASRRIQFIESIGYGCCGPSGKAQCRCGIHLGFVQADCVGSHWLLLFDNRIDRSDSVDGDWTIHSDVEAADDWLESTGAIKDGQRCGDWECWYARVTYVPTRHRDKNRIISNPSKLVIERMLLKLEAWNHGRLIETVWANSQS